MRVGGRTRQGTTSTATTTGRPSPDMCPTTTWLGLAGGMSLIPQLGARPPTATSQTKVLLSRVRRPQGPVRNRRCHRPYTGEPGLRYPYTPGPPQWGPVPTHVAPPASKGLRVGLWLAVGVATLEALVIAVLGIALIARSAPPSPIGSTVGPSGSFVQNMGHVVYSSNFGPNEPWGTGSVNSNTSATVSNNQYIVTGWTYVHHLLLTPYVVPNSGISVKAAATNYSAGDVSIGAGCQSADGISPALVYQLIVSPDDQWSIEEGRLGGSVETLLEGVTPPLGAAATLQLTCVMTTTTSGAETTQLVAYVDGDRVGSIGDQVGQSNIGGYVPVLALGTFGPTASAAFTNITVRSIQPST